MVSESVRRSVEAPSLTDAEKVHVPLERQVPAMVPVDPSSWRPGGSDPVAITHVNGRRPPDACNVAE
jgi:hypothetical protein